MGQEESANTSRITRILQGSASGPEDIERLIPLLYDDLRRVAQAQLNAERAGHTLQATALVHEAYLRLLGNTSIEWEGKAHFLGAAAQTIRRILVDHARARNADKRGGGAKRVELEMAEPLFDVAYLEVLALEEALEDLARLNQIQAQIVVFRVYAGMTLPEVTEALGLKLRTVEGDWSMAKRWLRARLSEDDE